MMAPYRISSLEQLNQGKQRWFTNLLACRRSIGTNTIPDYTRERARKSVNNKRLA
ncbi:hypothetical protein ACWNXI_15590 [Caldibacillus thermoamylovorans]